MAPSKLRFEDDGCVKLRVRLAQPCPLIEGFYFQVDRRVGQTRLPHPIRAPLPFIWTYWPLTFCRSSHTHRVAAVLVDELNAGQLKSPSKAPLKTLAERGVSWIF